MTATQRPCAGGSRLGWSLRVRGGCAQRKPWSRGKTRACLPFFDSLARGWELQVEAGTDKLVSMDTASFSVSMAKIEFGGDSVCSSPGIACFCKETWRESCNTDFSPLDLVPLSVSPALLSPLGGAVGLRPLAWDPLAPPVVGRQRSPAVLRASSLSSLLPLTRRWVLPSARPLVGLLCF